VCVQPLTTQPEKMTSSAAGWVSNAGPSISVAMPCTVMERGMPYTVEVPSDGWWS
jgi:hypothetical protein